MGKIYISLRWCRELVDKLSNTLDFIANAYTIFFFEGIHTEDRVGGEIFSQYFYDNVDNSDVVFCLSGISRI